MQIVLKYKSRLGGRGELVSVPDKDGQRLIKNGMATSTEPFQKAGEELLSSLSPAEQASSKKTLKKSDNGATKGQKKEK
jgi:hypothetical protein